MGQAIRETDERQRAVRAEIERLTAALKARGAHLVVLFGSRARGQATRWSDIDLLAVLPCPADETYAGRLARLATELDPQVPVDLLVYSPEEFAEVKTSSLFVREALEQGEVLHAE